jgi:hypothetical protein
MKVDKKINDDKTITISFCFNPEEYLMKDWEILKKAEEVIVKEIISLNIPITEKVKDMILKNKKQIIARAKSKAIEEYKKDIEDTLKGYR